MLAPTRYFILSLLFCIAVLPLHGQPVIVNADRAHQPIGLNVSYYLDETASLTIEDVIQQSSKLAFKKSEVETLNMGATKSACWIKFTYILQDSLSRFLAVGNTNLDRVDLYVLNGSNTIKSMAAGLSTASNDANANLSLNSWLFELPRKISGEPLTVVLKVSDRRRIIVPLEITTLNQEIRESHQEDFILGLYFGCLAIIAVMNVYFFLYFRERIYVLYGGHIFCQIIINGIIQGYLFTLFGRSSYFVSPYVPGIAGLSNVFVILFALAFLDVKQSLPRWYKPTLLLTCLPAINILLSAFGYYTQSAVSGTYIGIIVSIWLFILGLVAYSRKVLQARFYIVGWGTFFLGILILNSALNDWIDINAFTFNAALYGTLCEVLLVSFALADRINLIRIDREQERQQRLALIEQQKTWLEENVKVRTMEILQKTKEIEVQNEELRQQHEELTTTHELLEKQKMLVEEKNKDIGIINQNLEHKVKLRTFELEESVKNLIRQNHDLEQFSYIVSHNMRAPVARVLGLINLLSSERNPDERDQLMTYLKESTIGLDEIIHDLSQIIDLRRGSDMMMETVDLEKVIHHNLSDLTDEIHKANAIINLSIGARELVTVKGYIQSIIYNLISNAIKYRDPDRQLEIKISTSETATNVIVEIEDTGLGINLPEEKLHEIFHLYKRTHTHVQGKGLGLYLVKTQVEALNGHIEVSSTNGKGSYFRVSIPKAI